MDPVRYYDLTEIEGMHNDTLFHVAKTLGLQPTFNEIIWYYLKEFNMTSQGYTYLKVMAMKRDTRPFLDYFNLWPVVRQAVIKELRLQDRLREPLAISPKSPRLIVQAVPMSMSNEITEYIRNGGTYNDSQWHELSSRQDLTPGLLEDTVDDPRFKWDWANLFYESNLGEDFVATLWWSRHPDTSKSPPWGDFHRSPDGGNPDTWSYTHGNNWWYERKPKTTEHQKLIDVNKISYYNRTKYRPVYTTPELREILKELGLKPSGTKAELIVRLVDDIKAKDAELYTFMKDLGIIRWLNQESRGWGKSRFPRY